GCRGGPAAAAGRSPVGERRLMRAGPIEFATPLALLLLLAIPAWWRWRRRREARALAFSRVGTLARVAGQGGLVRRLLVALRVIVLATVVLALARPRTGARAENITTDGI